MRLGWGLALLAAGFACGGAAQTAPAQPPRPLRIMSLNLCTDLLLLQLVPKQRIASISFLAHDSVWAVRPGLDAGIATNRGTAEDVAAQHPDLILAADYSTPTVRRLARQIGAPLVQVRSADDFASTRAAIRQVGQAVGEPRRAETLVAQMDATLAALKAGAPPTPRVVAAWSGDSVPGKATLANAIIEAAGAVNVAARAPDSRYGTFDLEQLLAARPDALLYSGGRSRQPSARRDLTEHPLLMRLYQGRRLLYPDPPYTCGLPQSADAARSLRQALAALGPMARLR